MLRVIAVSKKKNDRIDASKICDCLRCDFLPECYITAIGPITALTWALEIGEVQRFCQVLPLADWAREQSPIVY